MRPAEIASRGAMLLLIALHAQAGRPSLGGKNFNFYTKIFRTINFKIDLKAANFAAKQGLNCF